MLIDLARPVLLCCLKLSPHYDKNVSNSQSSLIQADQSLCAFETNDSKNKDEVFKKERGYHLDSAVEGETELTYTTGRPPRRIRTIPLLFYDLNAYKMGCIFTARQRRGAEGAGGGIQRHVPSSPDLGVAKFIFCGETTPTSQYVSAQKI